MSNYHKIINSDGSICYYNNGDGSTAYYNEDGAYHRKDGPAYIHFDGIEEWYYNGKLIECDNQEMFERLIRLKAFW